jgi:hypothetical protein
MSVIERTQAKKLLTRSSGVLPQSSTRTIYFDGVAGTSHVYKSMAGNKAILDVSSLFRQGLNFGPTFHNAGPSSVTIKLALGDRNLSYLAQESGKEALLATFDNQWVDFAVLAQGESKSVDGAFTYTTAYIEFAAGSQGELRIGTN